MPQIYIDDQPLDIDITDELAQFTWHRATWSADKLIAQSPFRPDSTPSFYVYLRDTATARAGNFGDSGTGERGGIVKLLAHLRGESEAATADYLRESYGLELAQTTDRRTFKPAKLRPRPAKPRPLPECTLNSVEPAPIDYLTARGISVDVQREMGVGYDHAKNAAVLPWRLANGRLANVMYRAVSGKAFWYVDKALNPIGIRSLIYGINRVYTERWTEVALVEAPIDAMTLMSAGVPALATGGAAFNEDKAAVVLMSGIRSVTLVADNDEAGAKWQAECERWLSGKVALWVARVPGGSKDVNEFAGVGGLVNVSAIVDAKRRVGNVFRGLKW
jgi:hypothetical protein